MSKAGGPNGCRAFVLQLSVKMDDGTELLYTTNTQSSGGAGSENWQCRQGPGKRLIPNPDPLSTRLYSSTLCSCTAASERALAPLASIGAAPVLVDLAADNAAGIPPSWAQCFSITSTMVGTAERCQPQQPSTCRQRPPEVPDSLVRRRRNL